MLLVPILLYYNVLPEVIAYTGMYLATLSAIVTSITFIVSGVMPINYFVIIGLLTLVGVPLADWQVSKLVKKLGRQSLILFFFCVANLVATILVIFEAIEEFDGIGGLLDFKTYCASY